MVSKAEMYLSVLHEFEDAAGNVLMSAIITLDGLVMASTSSDRVNKEALAAYCAATYRSASDTMHELSQERTDLMMLESREHRMFSIKAGEEALLVALAGKAAKTGMMLLELNKAAEKLKAIMGAK